VLHRDVKQQALLLCTRPTREQRVMGTFYCSFVQTPIATAATLYTIIT